MFTLHTLLNAIICSLLFVAVVAAKFDTQGSDESGVPAATVWEVLSDTYATSNVVRSYFHAEHRHIKFLWHLGARLPVS